MFYIICQLRIVIFWYLPAKAVKRANIALSIIAILVDKHSKKLECAVVYRNRQQKG